jgi:hypothetical protein
LNAKHIKATIALSLTIRSIEITAMYFAGCISRKGKLNRAGHEEELKTDILSEVYNLI